MHARVSSFGLWFVRRLHMQKKANDLLSYTWIHWQQSFAGIGEHIQKVHCVTHASISARSTWLFDAALDARLWQALTWSSAKVWPSAVQ